MPRSTAAKATPPAPVKPTRTAPATVQIDPVNLRVLREKDGHSQTSLSEASGVSLSYICDIENGRRRGNAQTLAKLATALNIPKSCLETRRVG